MKVSASSSMKTLLQEQFPRVMLMPFSNGTQSRVVLPGAKAMHETEEKLPCVVG